MVEGENRNFRESPNPGFRGIWVHPHGIRTERLTDQLGVGTERAATLRPWTDECAWSVLSPERRECAELVLTRDAPFDSDCGPDTTGWDQETELDKHLSDTDPSSAGSEWRRRRLTSNLGRLLRVPLGRDAEPRHGRGLLPVSW